MKSEYTPETQFSEPRFSEMLNLTNKFKLSFSNFIQTQFSEQKGPDNHVH